MTVNLEIISPEEFKRQREAFENTQKPELLQTPAMQAKIQEFNELLEAYVKSHKTEMYLKMDQWGHTWADIDFIVKAGYHVSRNSHLGWEVALP